MQAMMDADDDTALGDGGKRAGGPTRLPQPTDGETPEAEAEGFDRGVDDDDDDGHEEAEGSGAGGAKGTDSGGKRRRSRGGRNRRGGGGGGGGGGLADAWDVAWQSELIKSDLARGVMEASEGAAYECAQLRREMSELHATVEALSLAMAQQDWALWADRLRKLEEGGARQAELSAAQAADVGTVVGELRRLSQQQDGAAEVTAQLRELTTVLYKSSNTVQMLVADAGLTNRHVPIQCSSARCVPGRLKGGAQAVDGPWR